MTRTTLPIDEILVIDRQRLDLGDIADLADSIARHGLIQPIVINQEKRLIAGGRRLAAHRHLGRTHIDVVYRETLTLDELHELELEENVRRKDMSWAERSLNILKIHRLKCKRSALEGSKWGMRETGELIGLAKSSVAYNTEIATRLERELSLPEDQRRYWHCDSFNDAWRLRLRDEEDALQASIAAETAIQSRVNIPAPVAFEPDLDSILNSLGDFSPETGITHSNPTVDRILSLRNRPYPDLTKDEARELYLTNALNSPETFDSYYEQKLNWLNQKSDVVYISARLHNKNCIDFMSDPGWKESFHHIITDPPYGIEMSNLDQQNQGMTDIDTVAAEHDVISNEQLFKEFFPAANHCLKDNGFLILWCDIMQWQLLYDLATSSGFKVQRWPITWVKTHRCMNQSAHQNFTKSTEIAMVCRKGTATLQQLAGECHILACHDEFKETLGHPFVKPFAVWEYIIDHVSMEGQSILDPFAGRGSCPISLIRKKRHFFACESNETHFNALTENVKQHYLKLNPNYKFA